MRELKAHRIQREIDHYQQELKSHQEKCKHVKATKIHKCNTGNYDVAQDRYWTQFRCPTCLKVWDEDGSL